MDRDIQKIFKSENQPVIPADFTENTIYRIQNEAIKMRRKRHFYWGVASFFSIASVIASGAHVFGQFSSSGFGSYVSLFFSDMSTVLTSWKDFAILILESIPAVAVSLFFITIVAVFFTARRFWSNNKDLTILSLTSA